MVMLIPLLLWSFTGLVFLIKPGYDGAYETLSPRLYDIPTRLAISPQAGWKEVKLFRTVLGDHLIVKDRGAWKHLDPHTLRERPAPSDKEIAALVSDAMQGNTKRYGNIEKVRSNSVVTGTGVVITLDWSDVTLHQRGADTDLIDTLYRIHYLQWLGDPTHDKLFGALGIVLLLALSGLGFFNYLNGRKLKKESDADKKEA